MRPKSLDCFAGSEYLLNLTYYGLPILGKPQVPYLCVTCSTMVVTRPRSNFISTLPKLGLPARDNSAAILSKWAGQSSANS